MAKKNTQNLKTDMASRVARLESHFLAEQEKKIAAEKLKEKKKADAAKDRERRERLQAKRREQIGELVAAKIKRITPAGWKQLDPDGSGYRFHGKSEGEAFHEAVRQFGKKYEVMIAPGFAEKNEGRYGEEEAPIVIQRTTYQWIVFGRRHVSGAEYCPCANCVGAGVVLAAGGKFHQAVNVLGGGEAEDEDEE